MAHKVKTKLTRAACEKIKSANAKSMREVREKLSRRNEGDKEDRGKRDNGGKECKEEEAGERMWRGLKVLKEIKK